jgi:hypothetical protein
MLEGRLLGPLPEVEIGPSARRCRPTADDTHQ